jgi:hypothetical protein
MAKRSTRRAGARRHQVEVQSGYYNNGLGARLTADWRSATRVDSATGEDLRFSDYATFDLRLFANLGERFDLVSKHPFFLGSSVRFEVKNPVRLPARPARADRAHGRDQLPQTVPAAPPVPVRRRARWAGRWRAATRVR